MLSETDNFIDQSPVYRREDLKRELSRFIESSPERYRSAKELTAIDAFVPLGLTDCGLIDFKQNAVIVTTDFHLVGRILAGGGLAVNLKEYVTARQ